LIRNHLFVLVASLLIAGCGNTPGNVDAGATLCLSDAQCSDGVFCNGAEVCAPASADADARGCVMATSGPCLSDQTCDDAGSLCVTDCAVRTDADGDGHDAVVCGGDDCADEDANRFPGNLEVCDAQGHDEDCDASTLGGAADADVDGDLEVSARCCNVQSDQSILCGVDCDDTRSSINASGVEVCNGLDEDCDGTLDEGVFATVYRDLDGDGFGNPATARQQGCGDPLFVSDNGDCDDTNAAVNPEAPEICDGRDSDCDGDDNDEVDADADQHLLPTSTCEGGPLPKDDCDDNDLSVHPAATDVCNDVDDDCDGESDERESANAACQARAPGATAACGYGGAQVLANRCFLTSCDRGAGDCDGQASNGCETDLTTETDCGGCGLRCVVGSCQEGRCVEDTFAGVAIHTGFRRRGVVALDGFRAVRWGDIGQLRQPSYLVSAGGAPIVGVDDAFGDASGECWLSSDGAAQCRGVASAAWGIGPGAGTVALDWIDTLVTNASEAEFGTRHGCAVDAAGSVTCWGASPGNGQSSTTESPTAVLLSGAAVADVALADDTSCALHVDGAVSCWGKHAGDGDTLASSVPARVMIDATTPLHATAIFGGFRHVCALDGTTPYCWGENGDWLGANGDGRFAGLVAPIATSMSTLALGERLTCGIDDAMHARCLGAAPLGDGSLGSSSLGEPVLAWDANGGQPAEVIALGAATEGTCYLDLDGRPWCWGERSAADTHPDVGQFTEAIPVPSNAQPTSLAADDLFACAVLADGTTRCWGELARLGAAWAVAGVRYPARQIDWPAPVESIAVRTTVACVVTTTGEVWCRGGSVDDGSDVLVPPPSSVGEASRIAVPPARQVVVSQTAACALLRDGGVRCWGIDATGVLGDGDGAPDDCDGSPCARSPVAVVGLPAGDAVVQLSLHAEALAANACARLASGRVVCWGAGGGGGLGTGALSPIYAHAPQDPVAGIDDAVSISTYFVNTCAVRAGGRVACWGGAFGALGYLTGDICGAFPCSPLPGEVVGVDDAIEVAVGRGFACARLRNGRVRCWGENRRGQLLRPPNETASETFAGGELAGVVGTTQLVAGSAVACALLGDRTFCWGGLGNSGAFESGMRAGATYSTSTGAVGASVTGM